MFFQINYREKNTFKKEILLQKMGILKIINEAKQF